MAGKHRSFAVNSAQKAKPAERLHFDVGEETFTGVVALPGAYLLRFAAQAQDSASSGEAVLDFIKRCVVPDEQERLTETLESPDQVVEMSVLVEIMEWLVEEYSARPTEESSP